jgi:hypothetical protein
MAEDGGSNFLQNAGTYLQDHRNTLILKFPTSTHIFHEQTVQPRKQN